MKTNWPRLCRPRTHQSSQHLPAFNSLLNTRVHAAFPNLSPHSTAPVRAYAAAACLTVHARENTHTTWKGAHERTHKKYDFTSVFNKHTQEHTNTSNMRRSVRCAGGAIFRVAVDVWQTHEKTMAHSRACELCERPPASRHARPSSAPSSRRWRKQWIALKSARARARFALDRHNAVRAPRGWRIGARVARCGGAATGGLPVGTLKCITWHAGGQLFYFVSIFHPAGGEGRRRGYTERRTSRRRGVPRGHTWKLFDRFTMLGTVRWNVQMIEDVNAKWMCGNRRFEWWHTTRNAGENIRFQSEWMAMEIMVCKCGTSQFSPHAVTNRLRRVNWRNWINKHAIILIALD